MAKYSFQTKKEVVMAYLNSNKSYNEIAAYYNIPSSTTINEWVQSYQKFGNEGLLRSRKNESYSFQFKLYVVELYLSTEVSYQELALTVEMNNPSLITRWVNDFRVAGSDALRPKKKGRKKTVGLSDNVKKSTSISEKISLDKDAERLKQLEDENLKLRLENAYLKELRRLRLEDEARLREQQESSTASEETSN